MLPKVLILNQPFNNHTGGGITLSNLFTGWDKDKLAVISYHYLLSNVDLSRCDIYYQLGYKEHKFIFPFNILKRKHFSGLVNFDEPKKEKIIKKTSSARVKMIMKYFNPILKYFGFYNSISRIELSDELCSWLDDFNPQIIYAQAPARESLVFVSLVHSYLKKPLVFHMMDDWINADKGPFKLLEWKKNEKEFKKLLNKADVLMSISEEMSEEYERKYGKKSLAFLNPINIEFWTKYQRKNYDLNRNPVILYAGRIGLGINSSLQLIAKAVQQVNLDLKIPVKFILQTKDSPAWIKNYKDVEHNSFVQYEKLPQIFSTVDLLILPYDFSSQSKNFIRFSMPTKAPEYMVSGTPIILFAPKETAIVKYAAKYKWAQIVDENDFVYLCDTIKYMLLNKKNREQLALNAVKAAYENHSSTKVVEDFRAVINSLLHKETN